MNKLLKYCFIAFSLLLGLGIYLGLRSTSSPFYTLAANLGFKSETDAYRIQIQKFQYPDWLVYSLPDGLWMFSFVLFNLTVWDFTINKQSKIWIYGSILMGLSYEILQSIVKGYGVFDWIDLGLMLLAVLVSSLFVSKNNLKNKSSEKVIII